MARAMRDARRQAQRVGLLTVLVAACAVIRDPPGGPPDFTAPVLLGVTPDSGAIVPELDDPVRIQFDEVINEQSGGGLDRLVQLSPRVEELKVDWKRSAIEVKPKDGWRTGLVYQLTLLAGVTDLRNNRTQEGRTVVFSTGTEIPDTRVTGTVLDWESNRVGRRALIEASLLPDSLVYVAFADSTGEFTLTSVPRGDYWITVTDDANTSGRREAREAYDSISVTLDSVAHHTFWMIARDTLGPQIREIRYVDSLTLAIEFTQKLEPGEPDSAAVAVFALPDTIPVAVAFWRSQALQDSIQAARERAAAEAARAAADSARAAADSAAAADTLGVADSAQVAVRDTAGPPVAGRPRPERPTPERAAEAVTQDSTAAPPDSTRAQRLLAERPVLSATWFVEMGLPLEPGARYLVRAVARNLSGAVAESQRLLVTPTPPDST